MKKTTKSNRRQDDASVYRRDLWDLQWMAARYANNRSTFSSHTVNGITERMILDGNFPSTDRTREAPEPTVWVKDGDFGWPMHLIDKYGWDGRKQQKAQEP